MAQGIKKARSQGRVYYSKVVYDGNEFEAGDDVYVNRREEGCSDDDDPEVEDCRICFKSGNSVMVECDDCLGGFHLKCLSCPLDDVPEGDWICEFCEARKAGKIPQLRRPPMGRKRRRTAREKLLSSDLLAARIKRLWKERDGSYWFRGCWYIIPEKTRAGRQPHNLRRELYATNDFADIEMESILRHCYVMNLKDFSRANNEGDDVFLCEYEYDVHWHRFKRLYETDEDQINGRSCNDEAWGAATDLNLDKDSLYGGSETCLPCRRVSSAGWHKSAGNSWKGRIFGLHTVGASKIPEYVRCHKHPELERAKKTLMSGALLKTVPCRDKEMEGITSFIRSALCEEQCLGCCLYIHGVPGTGKTMTVHAAMRRLKSEVDVWANRPYIFVEINGLKLASPEHIYKVLYEALTGHRVGWKKALHLLDEHFSHGYRNTGRDENQPCILVIDELDLLVTRNQSILYNILGWPANLNSRLVVIGIANTMDLPEKLLPRISSRMGIQRLCFGPYNYQQLQEIILSRLNGINAFEKQAIEFASRKVAAISGDARRVLEICRRAVEIVEQRLDQPVPSIRDSMCHDGSTEQEIHLVGMGDIESAIEEMFQAPHMQVMRSSSKFAKIILVAMVHDLYLTGNEVLTFEKLAMTVSNMCKSNSEACPEWDILMKVVCKLGECRILLCESSAKHRLQKLQLNFPSDDVVFALKDCLEIPWLAKYL